MPSKTVERRVSTRGKSKTPFTEEQKEKLMVAFFTHEDRNIFLEEAGIDRQTLRVALQEWEATPPLHKLMLLFAEAKKTPELKP